MSNELNYLAARTAGGLYNRRAFMGRAAALGIGAVMANSMLAKAVSAAGPKKGRHIDDGSGRRWLGQLAGPGVGYRPIFDHVHDDNGR